MIQWKEIDDALGAVVSAALKAANLPAVRERKDVKAPLVRRSYRIDVGQTDGMGTDDYAETGCDIEIYFYPADGTRPRDELNTAADAIRAALREGVTVQDVVLIPEDDIACNADVMDTYWTAFLNADGETLTVMLRLTWIETAEETGEFMEDMVYG